MKQQVKQINYITTCVFAVFIAVFAALFIFYPKRTFSEKENRTLANLPRFTLSSLASGTLTANYEKYVTDQFPFRDSAVTLNALKELALGKTENHSIYFAEGQTLIERFNVPREELVTNNINAVNALAQNTEIPVYVALIPGAVSIWKDKIPANAPNADQTQLMSEIFPRFYDVTVIALESPLTHREGEDVYFHTDHHWTALGAYYGYLETISAMGFDPQPLGDEILLSESFYGTAYSSSGAGWIEPDKLYSYVPEPDNITVYDYNSGEAVETTLYHPEQLGKKDKYSYFLGGNSPLRKIVTANTEASKLLILRDSYADIETPYFLPHFSEIHLMDLRYYKQSVKEYIEQNDIDIILVSYSVKNFCEDTNLFLLAY